MRELYLLLRVLSEAGYVHSGQRILSLEFGLRICHWRQRIAPAMRPKARGKASVQSDNWHYVAA